MTMDPLRSPFQFEAHSDKDADAIRCSVHCGRCGRSVATTAALDDLAPGREMNTDAERAGAATAAAALRERLQRAGCEHTDRWPETAADALHGEVGTVLANESFHLDLI